MAPPMTDAPDPAGPPGRLAARSRRARALRIAMAMLAVLGALLAAGLSWLGSESMLQTLAERGVAATAGRLSMTSPQGSLFGTVRVGRLVWHDGPLTVSVDDAVLAVRWRALLQRRLVLDALSAARVEVVTEPSGAPAAAPASLRAPIALEVPDARIGHLSVRQAGADAPLHLEDLRASLHYDRKTWTLDTLSLRGPFGALRASVTVGDTAPLPLSGSALLETTALDEPVAVDATLDGDLSALVASVRTVLRDASVSARLRLAPFAADPLAGVTLNVGALDLARFGAGLPQTRIEGRFEAERPPNAPAGAAPLPPLAGTLSLRNLLPGRIDAGRLPLDAIDASVSIGGDRIGVERLVLAGPPGRLSGEASLRLSPAATASAPGAPASPAARGPAPVQARWPEFDLRLATERLDLQRVHGALRPTELRGTVRVRPEADGLAFDARLADRELALEAQARWADDTVRISRARLQARDGVAEFSGTAGTASPYRFELAGSVARLDPARFADLPPGLLNGSWQVAGSVEPQPSVRASMRLADSRWRGLPLSGTVAARYEPDRLREVEAGLRLGGTSLDARGDLGAVGDRLALVLQAARLQEFDPRLAGRLSVEGELRDRLRGPGIAATVTGRDLRLEPRGGLRRLQARIEVARLDGLLAALTQAGVPGLPDLASMTSAAPPAAAAGASRRTGAGRPAAQVAPAADTVSLTLQADGLVWDGTTLDGVRAELAGTAARHALAVQVRAKAPALDARARIEGGFAQGAVGQWSGRLVEASNARSPRVALLGPAALQLSPEGVTVAQLLLEVDGADGARLRLDRASLIGGRAQVQGALEHVPLRWLAALGIGRGLRLEETDALRLGARIDLSGRPGEGGGLQGTVEAFRESGDLTVEAPAADGGTELIRAGLQQAELRAEIAGDVVRATLAVRGTTVGTIRAQAQAPLAWTAQGLVPRLDVPLTGTAELDVPSLAFTRALAGEAWRFDGALQARLTLAGTVAAPLLGGRVTGTRLVAEQRELGMRLSAGEFAATLRDNQLDIETLRFASGQGSVSMTGSLRPDERSEAVLVLDRMPIPLGAGQRLSLSGETRASFAGGVLRLGGALRADEGVIELTAGNAPRLARDVVVVRTTAEAERLRLETARRDGRRAGGAQAERRAGDAGQEEGPERGFRIQSDLQIDLGERFKVWGAGVDARLAGQLTLRGRLPDALRLIGTVRIVQGTYTGFGQKLEIERGTLVFSGPVDNPAIDIVAFRRYLPVEAGVALTGTARAPRLTLVSKPDVPDQDKLSWLVLGVGSDTARSGGQSAALQAAAATLLASSDPNRASPGIAQTFGLDVLSIRTGQTGSNGTTSSSALNAQDTVVTLGKRITQRLFVSYEQSLRGLENLLRLQYEISERLSARVRAGTQNAVDLLWTYRYD
jgi:translocation and assembly module TamB